MKDASTIGDDQVDREVKQEVARQNHQLEHRAYLLREQSKKNILAYKRDDAERIKENERIIR